MNGPGADRRRHRRVRVELRVGLARDEQRILGAGERLQHEAEGLVEPDSRTCQGPVATISFANDCIVTPGRNAAC
jgi:hypothetical protein